MRIVFTGRQLCFALLIVNGNGFKIAGPQNVVLQIRNIRSAMENVVAVDDQFKLVHGHAQCESHLSCGLLGLLLKQGPFGIVGRAARKKNPRPVQQSER